MHFVETCSKQKQALSLIASITLEVAIEYRKPGNTMPTVHKISWLERKDDSIANMRPRIHVGTTISPH